MRREGNEMSKGRGGEEMRRRANLEDEQVHGVLQISGKKNTEQHTERERERERERPSMAVAASVWSMEKKHMDAGVVVVEVDPVPWWEQLVPAMSDLGAAPRQGRI